MKTEQTNGSLRDYQTTQASAYRVSAKELADFEAIWAAAPTLDMREKAIQQYDEDTTVAASAPAVSAQSPITPIPLRTPSLAESEALAEGLSRKRILEKGKSSKSVKVAGDRLKSRLRAARDAQ